MTRARSTAEKPKARPSLPPEITEFELNDAFGFLFRRVDSLATRLFFEFSGQTTLSPRQYGVLIILSKAGQLSQKELSDIIRIDPSTLGEILRRMAARGLLARRTSTEDRRKVVLSLSNSGKRLLQDYFPAAARMQEELLAPIPPEDRDIVRAGLQAILTKLEG